MPTKKETLSEMTIQDLYCYYNIIKKQIDGCLIRLRMQMSDIERKNVNASRIKYNNIYDAVQEEINKRIFSIEV